MIKLTYDTQEELDFLFREEGNYEFLKILINKFLEMINTDFDGLTIIKITVKDTDTIYDMALMKSDIKEILEVNLPALIAEEDYELCSKVQHALNNLSN
jgi:hypothetical protein